MLIYHFIYNIDINIYFSGQQKSKKRSSCFNVNYAKSSKLAFTDQGVEGGVPPDDPVLPVDPDPLLGGGVLALPEDLIDPRALTRSAIC